MKLLVINCGSSSFKYEVFEEKGLRLIAGGLLEKIGTAEARLRQKRRLADGTFDFSETVEPVADHAAEFDLIGRINSRNRIIAGEEPQYPGKRL
jgi:acetate kinase